MNSLEINGKKYTWIFWDWLNTVYDPSTGELFNWVEDFFSTYPDLSYAIVSRAEFPKERMEKMKGASIAKYFKEFLTSGYDKSKEFEILIKKYEIPKDEILIVGDNRSSEGESAKKVGLDYMHISDFTNWWSEQSKSSN